MTILSRRTWLVATASIAALNVPVMAQAQEAATTNNDVGAVQDIIVTAERRETRLQDTPISITALSANTLADRGIRNLGDLGATAPNLSIVQSSSFGGGSTLQAYIRGVGAADYLFPNDPGVGLYVDGVYVARTMGGMQAITDVERIEVLKGPQGTLFGRNTIGGAISITTVQPKLTGSPAFDIEARTGSFSRFDGIVNVNAPLADGTAGLKLSAARISANGFGHQLTTGKDLGDEGKWVFRGALRIAPSDRLDLTLSGDYSVQRQNGPAGGISRLYPSVPTGGFRVREDLYNPFIAPYLNPILGLPAGTVFDQRFFTGNLRYNYATGPSYDNHDIWGLSLNGSYEAADWLTVKSITAYRYLKSDVAVDADGTPYPVFHSSPHETSKQFSQEIQLTGSTFGDRLSYLVGGYYSHERATDRTDVDIYRGAAPAGLPFLSLSQVSATAIRTSSYAVFTEERFKVLQNVTLIVGGRYTSDHKVYDKRVSVTELGFDLVPQTRLKDTFSAFTPKVGIDWKPTSGILLYGTYSQGFKSGGWNSRDNNVNAAVGNQPFRPERAETFEIGLKADWLDRALRTNLALFTSKYKDIQLTTLFLDPNTGAPTSTIENGGDARIKGFEAEITAVPVRGLTLNLNAGYIDDHYLSISPNAVRTGITLADRLSNISRWNAYAGATYETSVGGLGTVRIHGDATYRSQVYFDNLNTAEISQPGYTLYTARIAFTPAALPKLELAVSGTNLTDKTYKITSFLGSVSGYDYSYIGRPREITISAKYKF
ncbi:TonB-dependent receptor [Aquisediminimonas profunda]|uniref:TonB-dependent receptor n=1 Tax=Aquisediminimonas profunda TaxID=1550733 RepID=UPI001C6310C8|nr:TonB-dependent receptor [Aquisediminimonas profunda]